MNRIVLHLLLSVALVLQGIAGVYAATAPQPMHGGCCPHGQLDATHVKCPCPQKQQCTTDCQLMCATSAVPLIVAQAFLPQLVAPPALQRAHGTDPMRVRVESPPIRPPIA